MRCSFNSCTAISAADKNVFCSYLFKSFKANVSLSQISWKAVPQFWISSCKTPVSVAVGPSYNTWPWCDDDLHRRPTDSWLRDRLEQCQTVTDRPGWLSWNSLNIKLEASAAPEAPAWCVYTAESHCQTTDVQPHSGQMAAGSSDLQWCYKTVRCSSPWDTKWMLDQHFYGLGWKRSDEQSELQ